MATIARSVSQSFTPTESLSITISIWAYINSHSDTLSLTDSGLSRSVATYRFSSTLSDSLSTSESLSKAVDTWRYILSLSDSFSNTESLSRTVSTYRIDTSLSDSFSNSESLSKSVDTWRHVLSYSMSLTPSEALQKTVDTWRHANTFTDSSTVSDSLSLNVTNYLFIESFSDSVTPSESLSVSTQLWYHPFTNGDSVTVNDGLTVQITIDNDIYFYDNYGMDTATKLIGSITSGNFTSDTSTVSNADSLHDGATFIPCTYNGASNAKACVVFDFGAQVSVNFIAVFVESTLSNPLRLYASNSQGSGYQEISNMVGSSGVWQITEFTAVTYRYFAVQIESMSADVKIGEFIIGKYFQPEVHYDLGNSIIANDNVKINESLSGTEYVHRTQDASYQIKRTYASMSPTLKSNFEDLSNKSNAKKIIYNFNEFYYGFLEPISFREVAHNRYEAEISMLT